MAQLLGLVPTTQLSGTITTGQVGANAIGAGQIAAGAVTAGTIAAGAVVAGTVAAGAVVAGTVAAGAIDGTAITGATITGGILRTAAAGLRIELAATSSDQIRFYTGDANEVGPGYIMNRMVNHTPATPGTRFPNILFIPPSLGGSRPGSTVNLDSPTFDNSTPGRIALGAETVEINTSGAAQALSVNGSGLYNVGILNGTPAAVSGVAGALGINTLSPVAAYPFPTIQCVSMGCFIAGQTVATDTFDFYLRKDNVPIVRARGQGAGTSTATVVYSFLVPANTSTSYQNVMSRATGSGTGSSTADGSLNYLQIVVTRAGI